MSWQSAEVARKLLAESEGIDFDDSGHVINRQHGFSVASFDPGLRAGPTLLKGVPNEGELDRGTRQHAVAVCCDDKGRRSWKLCTVLARKGPSKLLVEWEEDCSHHEVLRLHCMLAHEDVHNFCQRVGRSLRARTSAEAFLRYNAFLDNMPFSGNPGLTDRQIGCILALAMNNASLKQLKISRTSIEVITSEVTSEYNRTINKMVLDAMLVNHQHKGGFPHLAPRKSIEKRPVPFLGTITLPLYDYQVRTATFLENTYMDKSEAIAALEAVRTECGKVIGLSMFQTKFTGTMDISDFSSVQTEQSKSTSQVLKRVWCEKLRAEIFKAFSRVPEDSEMSIDISNRASFEGSKLQRLFITINFVMEETLRVLTEDACREYVDFVRTATAYHVEVLGTKDVSIFYNHPFKDGCKECAPLFALELVPVAGAFKFSTPVDSFESEPVMLFDAALRMLHDVPQITPSIMRRLFLGKQKFVKSVTEDCPLILDMRERMAADLKHACQPLRHYMRQFDSYLEFVNTDLAEYVRTYEEKEGTLGQDELEIEQLLVLRKQVEDRVPQFIKVGTFNIKLQAISVFLFKKYSLLISMIMSIIAEKAASKSQIVVANFSSVHERLNIQTTNIEEVAALEDFIAEIPKNTDEVRTILGDTLQQFEVCFPHSARLPPCLCKVLAAHPEIAMLNRTAGARFLIVSMSSCRMNTSRLSGMHTAGRARSKGKLWRYRRR
jgi:dynein heavy chain